MKRVRGHQTAQDRRRDGPSAILVVYIDSDWKAARTLEKEYGIERVVRDLIAGTHNDAVLCETIGVAVGVTHRAYVFSNERDRAVGLAMLGYVNGQIDGVLWPNRCVEFHELSPQEYASYRRAHQPALDRDRDGEAIVVNSQ
jgi:hypothetical protein